MPSLGNEYEILNDRPYAILWRKKGSELTDLCPFCGLQHSHGSNPGHRIAHCSDTNKTSQIIAQDGTILYQIHGYIIIEY